MRSFILVLPLLCLAVHADEIEGWKVMSGNWTQNKDSIQTTGGTLFCEAKAKKGFMLKCRITVHEWLAPIETANVCIFWAFKGTKPGEPEWGNRHLFVLKPDYVYVAGPDGAGRKKHEGRLPLGKPLSISIKSTQSKTEIVCGKVKLETHIMYTDPNSIALVVTGAEVVFEKIRIKTK